MPAPRPDPTHGGQVSPSEGLHLPPLDQPFDFDTEQLAASAEVAVLLQESAERFYRVFSVSPASIFVARMADRLITHCNDGFLRLFGCTRDEVIGQSLATLDLYSPETDLDVVFARLANGDVVRYESQRVRQRDGDLRDVIASYVTIDVAGERAVVGKLVDVTDIRRLEHAVIEATDRERLRLGQELHDGLSSHLTGLRLQMKALADALADERHGQAATAQKLLDLLQETGGMIRRLSHEFAASEIGPARLVEVLRALAAQTNEVPGITCTFEGVDVMLPEGGAATHLYRIAQEAVQNALRHSTCVHILIRLDQIGERFRLTIEDDGCGLPEAFLQPGTDDDLSGLGLFSMRARARAIGAKLHLYERPGGGTRIVCVREHASAPGARLKTGG